MKFSAVFILLFSSSLLLAQRLHLPDDIARIMERSSIQYQVDTFGYQGSSISFPKGGQVDGNWLQINESDNIRLEKQEDDFPRKIRKSLRIGDKNYRKKKFSKARECYQVAYKANNTSPLIINKIAHTYEQEKDYGTASYWYERSLEYNPINTAALLGSARAYEALGHTEKAVNTILLAHLYNINDKKITLEMSQLLARAGKKYKAIHLQPTFSISKTGNIVNIASNHPIWAKYAAVQALWKYEPNYADKMKSASKQSPTSVALKESIMNALVAYTQSTEKNKKTKFPLLELLSKISFQQQINNFVLYEIEAKQNPDLLLRLPIEKIEVLQDYILNFRSRL